LKVCPESWLHGWKTALVSRATVHVNMRRRGCLSASFLNLIAHRSGPCYHGTHDGRPGVPSPHYRHAFRNGGNGRAVAAHNPTSHLVVQK
jgi:hypothetical protein